MAGEIYRITVGEVGEETEAERDRLATDLEERIITSDLEVISIRRESEHPGETMAAGPILSLELAERLGRSLLEAIRSWLASRRTEVELETPDGRKIKISAANVEEAMKLYEAVHRD